ncbi:hypothetical protein FXB76_04635 [Aggregatibacter actinomycetemcomitans]|nr:hypothetical protein FXE10_04460 [Aggregatibacter actinomycetemcomitans]TYA33233.1 hypothetical protein FXB69_03370 [Aggregatibacter actinomycetemcomitans]TYB01362.1 hypothetical protein FXB93_04380 [Aggregatibacter actinomycetemcomitans]TYB15628.1 hypothetical protein FXB65_04440 [Aggregatibacter actinomycetemcomitans]TYB16914.1 hypothetical protein FXB76_04635 [Aggregatibacter actinomycetemcomitans]
MQKHLENRPHFLLSPCIFAQYLRIKNEQFTLLSNFFELDHESITKVRKKILIPPNSGKMTLP